MGARAAVIAATEHLQSLSSTPHRRHELHAGSGTSVDVKLVLASYPLKGPKDIRDQILLDLPGNVEVLFVVGDGDAMCPLNLLDETRKKMVARSRLVVVKGADHGMHVNGKGSDEKAGELAGMRACEWVGGKLDEELVDIMGDEDEDAS